MKAKQNLELKHYCDNFKEVRKVLKELGAIKEVLKDRKTISSIYLMPRKKKKLA